MLAQLIALYSERSRKARKLIKRVSLVSVWFLLGLPPMVNAETLYLTSLHWPPYSGSQLKEQGAYIAVARAALDAVGHTLVVDFYPWSRAVRLASRKDGKYLGYLPEYAHPTEKFIFSEAMGRSGLGLVEQKAHPISWTKQSDLNQYTIGVVQDYINTAEFDAMLAQGLQPAEVVASDLHNVNKVGSGRIDAAIIDEHVLAYTLAQPNMQHLKGKLQLNKKLLTYKELFVAFKNNEEGQKWRERFNQGLVKIDAQQIIIDSMAK